MSGHERLIPIAEPPRAARAEPRRIALLELGFRPFYLLGALFAALAVPAWIAVLHGGRWSGALNPFAWHQHEMVFGFGLAVISGFMLTASRAWTGIETARHLPLALLALHWIAARVLMFTGPLPVAAVVDVAFPIVMAGVIARVLLKARNYRNLVLCALLLLLAAADACFFLEPQRIPAGKSVTAALYVVIMLVTVMGGRVIPPFTANALRSARVARKPRSDVAAIALTLAAFACALVSAPAWVVAPLATLAAGAQLWRQSGWGAFATLRHPILWVLHLSYAWIAVGLALLALEALSLVTHAAVVHALGIGAMAGMIIAMVTRTALGHTGRPLHAGAPETAAYLLVHAGALVRLLAALAPGVGHTALIDTSAALWATAFSIYFVVYFPRLLLARIDGKPG